MVPDGIIMVPDGIIMVPDGINAFYQKPMVFIIMIGRCLFNINRQLPLLLNNNEYHWVLIECIMPSGTIIMPSGIKMNRQLPLL